MKTIRAQWGHRLLSWFWSDQYWYVTQVSRVTGDRVKMSHPVGCGETRDQAFFDYKNQLNVRYAKTLQELKEKDLRKAQK